MNKKPLSQHKIMSRIDAEADFLPRLHNWNVTSNGITGQVQDSPHYCDGQILSEAVMEIDGPVIRTSSGRRYELMKPCHTIAEQMMMEFAETPLGLVEIRVDRNASGISPNRPY